jgi:hypothetical protein
MARKNELLILISQDGTVTVEVDGVRGASCLDLTGELEESLGLVRERERKPAFYEGEEGRVLAAAGESAGETVEGKP